MEIALPARFSPHHTGCAVPSSHRSIHGTLYPLRTAPPMARCTHFAPLHPWHAVPTSHRPIHGTLYPLRTVPSMARCTRFCPTPARTHFCILILSTFSPCFLPARSRFSATLPAPPFAAHFPRAPSHLLPTCSALRHLSIRPPFAPHFPRSIPHPFFKKPLDV
jgi:hypothetical protein